MERTTGLLYAGAGLVPDSAAGKYGNNVLSVLDSVYASYTKAQTLALLEKNWSGRIWVDSQPFVWAPSCTIEDSANLLSMRPTANGDSAVAGRFVPEGPLHVLRLPFTKDTADGAALYTVPTGVKIQILALSWNITTSMTGGSSAAIGVSSDKTGFTAKGCLLGGKTGDVLASLTAAASPTLGTKGFLALPAGSRLVRENVAVATASATPTMAVEQLLYAKTIGTGAAGVKNALINGGTPSAGEAAPVSNGSTVAFHAETTGTGTADLIYLTNVGVSIENTLWVAGDTIRFDRITSAFTAGVGTVNVLVRLIQLPWS